MDTSPADSQIYDDDNSYGAMDMDDNAINETPPSINEPSPASATVAVEVAVGTKRKAAASSRIKKPITKKPKKSTQEGRKTRKEEEN